jgi:hypothetical protein
VVRRNREPRQLAVTDRVPKGTGRELPFTEALDDVDSAGADVVDRILDVEPVAGLEDHLLGAAGS